MEMEKWQQAGQLMQPALIRLIDQIRKQLEQTDWQGTYETIETWPPGITPAVQSQVVELQAQLDQAQPDQVAALEQALQALPQPDRVYLLRLQKQEHTLEVNLWHLCYQVCFRHYDPAVPQPAAAMQVDTDLFEPDQEVDWHALDQKAQKIVHQVLERLPARVDS